MGSVDKGGLGVGEKRRVERELKIECKIKKKLKYKNDYFLIQISNFILEDTVALIVIPN